MTTKKPRLTITINPVLAAQLRKLSALTGNSQSALIADLLDGSGPVFDRIIETLEAAKTATDSIKGKMANDMQLAQTRMEDALGIALDTFDTFTGQVIDDSQAITAEVERRGAHGKRSAGAPRGSTVESTPLSNRGVRYLTTEQNTDKSGSKSSVSSKKKVRKS
jgi:hypothetical protein